MAAIVGGILLVILGAVVAFAVDAEVAGLNVSIVGVILMVVGVAGLVFGLTVRRRATGTTRPGQAGPREGR